MKKHHKSWAMIVAALVAGLLMSAGFTGTASASRAESGGSAAPAAAAPAEAAAVPAEAAAVLAARCCHITIPGNYVYNPNTNYQRTLHDYCSYSPDQFPSPGKNADFRGPCARHDLCYQHHQKSQLGCDNQFHKHLHQECTYTYAWYDPRRGACQNAANTYYAAVVIHTLWP